MQMIKLQATALRMMPIPESVTLPFFAKMFDAEGSFDPRGETQEKAADAMLTSIPRLEPRKLFSTAKTSCRTLKYRCVAEWCSSWPCHAVEIGCFSRRFRPGRSVCST